MQSAGVPFDVRARARRSAEAAAQQGHRVCDVRGEWWDAEHEQRGVGDQGGNTPGAAHDPRNHSRREEQQPPADPIHPSSVSDPAADSFGTTGNGAPALMDSPARRGVLIWWLTVTAR